MNNFVAFIFLDNDYKCLRVPHCPISVSLNIKNLL